MKDIALIQYDLLQKSGVGTREIDPALWDLGTHAVAGIRCPFRTAGYAVEMTPSRVLVATYVPPVGALPPVPTAALIEGAGVFGEALIPFVIRVAFGTGEEHKRLVYHGPTGPRREIALDESGVGAHYRALRSLLTAPSPDLKLSLAEAVAAVKFLADANRLATSVGTYAFGETPAFLRQAIVRSIAA